MVVEFFTSPEFGAGSKPHIVLSLTLNESIMEEFKEKNPTVFSNEEFEVLINSIEDAIRTETLERSFNHLHTQSGLLEGITKINDGRGLCFHTRGAGGVWFAFQTWRRWRKDGVIRN